MLQSTSSCSLFFLKFQQSKSFILKFQQSKSFIKAPSSQKSQSPVTCCPKEVPTTREKEKTGTDSMSFLLRAPKCCPEITCVLMLSFEYFISLYSVAQPLVVNTSIYKQQRLFSFIFNLQSKLSRWYGIDRLSNPNPIRIRQNVI